MEGFYDNIELLRESNPKRRTYMDLNVLKEHLKTEGYNENEIVLVEELENIGYFVELCVQNNLVGDCEHELSYVNGALKMKINSEIKVYANYILGALLPIHHANELKDFKFEMESVNIALDISKSWCDLLKTNKDIKAIVKKESKKVLKDFPMVLTKILDDNKYAFAVLIGLSHYYYLNNSNVSMKKFG